MSCATFIDANFSERLQNLLCVPVENEQPTKRCWYCPADSEIATLPFRTFWSYDQDAIRTGRRTYQKKKAIYDEDEEATHVETDEEKTHVEMDGTYRNQKATRAKKK